MKIYLSKYWRINSLVNFCVMIFIIVGTVLFFVWSNDSEDYIMVLAASLYVLILGCILVGSKRFHTYVIVEKHEIYSYSLFSKKLCTITTTNPIYYAVFTTPQGLNTSKFIALSNEPFEYQTTYGVAKVRFIQHYNMEKIIVLPYNIQTIPILNLDEWHKIN